MPPVRPRRRLRELPLPGQRLPRLGQDEISRCRSGSTGTASQEQRTTDLKEHPMSLKIRLTRAGAKKRPYYRIVIADARAPRDGRFIEKVGTYDPMKPKDDAGRVNLDVEKIQAWLAKGAQPTDRVLRFLDAAGLLKRSARNNPNKAVPGKKAHERAGGRRRPGGGGGGGAGGAGGPAGEAA